MSVDIQSKIFRAQWQTSLDVWPRIKSGPPRPLAVYLNTSMEAQAVVG